MISSNSQLKFPRSNHPQSSPLSPFCFALCFAFCRRSSALSFSGVQKNDGGGLGGEHLNSNLAPQTFYAFHVLNAWEEKEVVGCVDGVDSEPIAASGPSSVIKVYSCDFRDIDMDFSKLGAGSKPRDCQESLVG